MKAQREIQDLSQVTPARHRQAQTNLEEGTNPALNVDERKSTTR